MGASPPVLGRAFQVALNPGSIHPVEGRGVARWDAGVSSGGERGGLVKRVGTRDGSALSLVSGSVRRPGFSIRAEMKEKEQTHTMWTHLIAVGLGRRKEFKRILFLRSVRESLNT